MTRTNWIISNGSSTSLRANDKVRTNWISRSLIYPEIMAIPYLARFKMSSMASYDGSKDADEHLENYQAYMLIQNANKAALCKAFCLTLTSAAGNGIED